MPSPSPDMPLAAWLEELPVAVTVTAADGTITAMNRRSAETFADDGGLSLLGTNLFTCHPEPSRTKTKELYAKQTANHYTIEKAGQRKIIHQLPWYRDGVFAGFVEISIPIPQALPHFQRD